MPLHQKKAHRALKAANAKAVSADAVVAVAIGVSVVLKMARHRLKAAFTMQARRSPHQARLWHLLHL